MNNNYSIVIQWSQKDNCFVASLPEWGNYNTHGKTYEQALSNAQKILDALIRTSLYEGKPLPEAKTFKVSSVAK